MKCSTSSCSASSGVSDSGESLIHVTSKKFVRRVFRIGVQRSRLWARRGRGVPATNLAPGSARPPYTPGVPGGASPPAEEGRPAAAPAAAAAAPRLPQHQRHQLPCHDCQLHQQQLHQQQHHHLRPAASAASRLPFRLASCPALQPFHNPARILQAASPETLEDFAKVMFCEVFRIWKSSNN